MHFDFVSFLVASCQSREFCLTYMKEADILDLLLIIIAVVYSMPHENWHWAPGFSQEPVTY